MNPELTEKETQVYIALKDKVERTAGRKMCTPRDFEYLSMSIFNRVKINLSVATLKRFWGYVGKNYHGKPYRSTLNILAQYAGYVSYEFFVENFSGSSMVESEFITNETLAVGSLAKDAEVELRWFPDRCVTLKYMGMQMFKVIGSINSKLNEGDTFMVDQIIDGESLILRCLVHNGSESTNYICGKVNGVKFRVL